jgi:arylsulfatase A-like enzyme
VPAIISWQGKIKQGLTSDFIYSSVDYLPTLCAVAGIKSLPEDLDGISIQEEIFNPESGNFSERPLYWHYPHFSNQLGRPAGAVRLGQYKLVELYENGKLELYDLENDISESVDLSEKMPGKVDELFRLLKDWRKSVDANMPVKKSENNK